MTKFIFNEDGLKLGITDVISYLSVQLELDNIVKVLAANYYWDLFNKSMDILIDEGFFEGNKYSEGGTVDDTIKIIEDFITLHYDYTEKDIFDLKTKIVTMVSDEIEGFDSLLLKIPEYANN